MVLLLFLTLASAQSTDYVLKRIQDIEPTAGDAFSSGIALSDSELFVGAPNYDYFQIDRFGVVHVFKKNPVGEWKIVQTLTSQTNERNHLFFGREVHYAGGELFISSVSNVKDNGSTKNRAGSVECFRRDDHGNWTFVQLLTAPDPQNNDQFGSAIDRDGDWLVIGAPLHDYDVNGADFMSDAGAVYMFHKEDTGWAFHRKLTSGLRSQTMRFGSPLSLHKDRLLVGTFFDRVFDFNYDGFTWRYNDFYDPTAPPRKSFGSALVQSDRWVAIGASTEVAPGSDDKIGSVYIYRKEGSRLRLITKVKPHSEVRGGFGMAIAVMNDRLVVSSPNLNHWNIADAGCIYVYKVGNTQTVELVDNVCHNSYEAGTFARKIESVGGRILISSPNSPQRDQKGNIIGSPAGAAFIVDYDFEYPTVECPTLYPNPASASVRLYPQGETMPELYNSSGQRSEIRKTQDGLDVSHLRSGIYFLRSGTCSYRLMLE